MFLSQEKLRELFARFDMNDVTGVIWKKMVNYICSGDEEIQLLRDYTRRLIRLQKYEYNGQPSAAFNGIINNIDRSSVEIAASSFNHSHYPHCAADLTNLEEYYESSYEENGAWLKYDFRYLSVRPTSYSIRSHNQGEGRNHPRNWVIEGSNTDIDSDWKLLDSRNGINSLNGRNLVATFNIQTELAPNEFFRFIRIRQTGNDRGWYYLTISALEFFGTIAS